MLPLAPASAQQVENITFYSIVSALEEAYPFSSYPPGYTPCLSDSYPAPYSYARECVLVCTRRYDPCLGLRINNNNKTMESGAVGLFKLQTQKKKPAPRSLAVCLPRKKEVGECCWSSFCRFARRARASTCSGREEERRAVQSLLAGRPYPQLR